jgi:hypothetical protein
MALPDLRSNRFRWPSEETLYRFARRFSCLFACARWALFLLFEKGSPVKALAEGGRIKLPSATLEVSTC